MHLATKVLLASLPLGLLLAPAATVGDTTGDFHTGATLICSDCHVMHASQQHGYNPDGSGFFLTPDTTPHEYLLRAEVNDLCLSCHDQSSVAPDVLDANGGKYPGIVRNAGFLNRDGVIGQPATGHTLDTLDTAPGGTWKPEDDNGTGHGLNCVNCHNQHGYAGGVNTYRNMKMDPGGTGFAYAQVTYAIGTNNLALDVFETAANSYDFNDINYNEPDTNASTYGKWCGGCHTNFYGAPGGTEVGGVATGSAYEEFHRHPVAGVDIGALGGGHSSLAVFAGHTNHVKVMSASGVWDGSAADITPSCMSCHKSHGNGNAFGLIWMSGTGTITENGDTDATQKEALCGQCHVQGS
ncbi:MAG: hypothetical protein D6702_02490 [Planctomycetota bacterium]|nr:MAG: hypothetical protein D6702_02490 [Planctomycetota bacterium]